MTAWERATCAECGEGIGVRQPLFSLAPREGHAWDPFVGCSICGELRCAACGEGAEGCCGEPWQRDTYPPVWLNTQRTALRPVASCVVCRAQTRVRTEGRPDPAADDSRWFACPDCAAELCEPCAERRGSRCWCGAFAGLREVPGWEAYLPAGLRERHAGLSEEERARDLTRVRAELVASYERGERVLLEVRERLWAIDGLLRQLGVEPGPSPS